MIHLPSLIKNVGGPAIVDNERLVGKCGGVSGVRLAVFLLFRLLRFIIMKDG
jgi:hypothetical protein